MHPDSRVFRAEIPANDAAAAEEFQQAMDSLNDAVANHCKEVGKSLQIPEQLANQIVYLRSRSRWSQDLEDRIIVAHRASGVTDFRCLAGEEEEVLNRN